MGGGGGRLLPSTKAHGNLQGLDERCPGQQREGHGLRKAYRDCTGPRSAAQAYSIASRACFSTCRRDPSSFLFAVRAVIVVRAIADAARLKKDAERIAELESPPTCGERRHARRPTGVY